MQYKRGEVMPVWSKYSCGAAIGPVLLANSDLLDTVRVERLRFFTPASAMLAILAAARDGFRGRASLQMEVLALRHQLTVLQRSVKRAKLYPCSEEDSNGGQECDAQ